MPHKTSSSSCVWDAQGKLRCGGNKIGAVVPVAVTTGGRHNPLSFETFNDKASSPMLTNDGTAANDQSTTTFLAPGEQLRSSNGRFVLKYGKTDGTLAIHDFTTVPSTVVWNAGVSSMTPKHARIQRDGNFVLYDTSDKPYWDANVRNQPTGPYRLVMQDDRNLVIYNANTNQAVWNTRTQK